MNTIKDINTIIAIGSAKGGVGKSTIAYNIAKLLSLKGLSIGILDADICGPSQANLFKINNNNHVIEIEDNAFMPILISDIKLMSIGCLIKENDAILWKTPMIIKAINQLLHETRWGKLDVLLLDLPPGTSDIHITISQKVKINHTILVTTPQELSTIDTKRSIKMFSKIKTPILGIIENMSSYKCKNCNHIEYIFEKDGGSKISNEYSIPLLDKLPLKSNPHYNENKTQTNIEIVNSYSKIINKIINAL